MKKPAADWLVDNLFPSLASSLVTVVLCLICIDFGYEVLKWVFIDAKWYVIGENIRLFLVGTFPTKATWRVWIAADVLSALFGAMTALVLSSNKHWRSVLAVLAVGIVSAYAGGMSVLWNSLLAVTAAYAGLVVF